MRKSRRNILKAGGIGAALSLAGCLGDDDGGGDDGSGDGGSDDGSTDDGSDDGSTDDGSDDGSMDDGSDDGGTTDIDGPITMGVLFPGQLPDGQFTKDAARYAASEWNDEGGLLGAEVEIATADTGAGQAEAGQEAGRRLVDQENVDLLTGGFATEAILPVMNRIAGQGPVWVASSAGSAEVPNRVKQNPERFKYYFTPTPVTPTVLDSMTVNLENIVQPDTDVTSVVPVREDLAWAQTFTDRLRDNASDISVEDEIAFAFDTSDFSTVLSEMENSGADMAMMGMAVADAVSFVSQWADSETSVGLTGILPPATNQGFADQVGEAAIGVGPQQLGAPAPVSDLTLPFVEGYTEMFGTPPSSQAYLTYDAVYAMFEAVEMAGTLEPDPVVAELEEYNQPGAVGTTTFQDLDDEFPHTPVMDIEDGKWYTQTQWQEIDGSLEHVMVGPDEWAGHDGEQSFQLPPWM